MALEAGWVPEQNGRAPIGGREWLAVQLRAARDLPARLRQDAATESAAGMSFFLVFGLFPALLFGVSLLPYMPLDAPVDHAFESLRPLLPPSVFDMLANHVQDLLEAPRHGLITASAVIALYSASRATVSLSRALNRAHRVPALRSEFGRRLRSMGLTLCVLLGIVVGVVALGLGGRLLRFLADHGLHSASSTLGTISWWFVLLSGSSLAVQQLYHLLPDHRPRRHPWSVGSVAAVMGWVATTWGFTHLAERFLRFNVTYGSLGSAAALMAWMYLGSLALIVGGTFNALVARGLPDDMEKDDD